MEIKTENRFENSSIKLTILSIHLVKIIVGNKIGYTNSCEN